MGKRPLSSPTSTAIAAQGWRPARHKLHTSAPLRPQGRASGDTTSDGRKCANRRPPLAAVVLDSCSEHTLQPDGLVRPLPTAALKVSRSAARLMRSGCRHGSAHQRSPAASRRATCAISRQPRLTSITAASAAARTSPGRTDLAEQTPTHL